MFESKMVAVFVVTEELLVAVFTLVQGLFTVNPPEINAFNIKYKFFHFTIIVSSSAQLRFVYT